MLMPWVDSVSAILEAWNPGQEDGNIVARLLFGLANPSGKLPVTYPKLASDTPTNTAERYPGVTAPGALPFGVSIARACKWAIAGTTPSRYEPLFAFGHGLSYTTFALSDLSVTPKISDGRQPITVRFSMQNTGTVRGAEVPQLYIGIAAGRRANLPSDSSDLQKVWLNPGELKQVALIINPAASSHPLGIFDSAQQRGRR